MGLLDRFFSARRVGHEATAVDRARSQKLEGREVGQTASEQAATRGRMEAEMDAQRERRQHLTKPST